jgi:hypothetical protein
MPTANIEEELGSGTAEKMRSSMVKDPPKRLPVIVTLENDSIPASSINSFGLQPAVPDIARFETQLLDDETEPSRLLLASNAVRSNG